MNLEIRGPSSQSHFLSLRSTGGQFSWGRALMQGGFNSRTAHCRQISCHVPLCRIVTDAGTSGQQRQQTWEQVTLLPPRLAWRQPKTQTTPGSPLTPSVLCLHIFIQERNTAKIFHWYWSLQKITAITFVEICPLLCFPNPTYFQGAPELTPDQSTCAHLQVTDGLRPYSCNIATKSSSSRIWTHICPYRDSSSALITVSRLFNPFI